MFSGHQDSLQGNRSPVTTHHRSSFLLRREERVREGHFMEDGETGSFSILPPASTVLAISAEQFWAKGKTLDNTQKSLFWVQSSFVYSLIITRSLRNCQLCIFQDSPWFLFFKFSDSVDFHKIHFQWKLNLLDKGKNYFNVFSLPQCRLSPLFPRSCFF